MSQFDNIIFGKKKFSDVLEEIYNNQKKKDQQVTALINELKPLISDIGDATFEAKDKAMFFMRYIRKALGDNTFVFVKNL